MFRRVVVLLLLISGCVQEPAAEPVPEADDDTAPIVAAPTREAFEVAVVHDACHGIEVLATAPASQLRAHVPDDFDLEDEPLLAFGAFRCGRDGESVGRAFLAIQVTPRTADLESPRAENYFWEPEHYLDATTAIAEAYNATGGTWMHADIATAVGTLASGFAVEAGNATYSFSASATGPPGTSGTVAGALVPFREYSAAEGGYAYLDAGFGGQDGVSGIVPGTLQASGGLAAEIFGTSSTRPAITMSELEYTDAVVGFLPRP